MAVNRNTSVKRKLYYNRVEWSDLFQGQATLESLLLRAHNALPIASERVFTIKGKDLTGAKYRSDINGLLLYITLADNDQPMGAISRSKPNVEVDTDLILPPTNKDFLEMDFFILIKDNHVIFCSSGNKYSLVTFYFRAILEAANFTDSASLFELRKIANIDKIHMIESEGVAQIDMDVNLYMQSIARIRNNVSNRGRNMIANMRDCVINALSTDRETAEDEVAENLMQKVKIKMDKKGIKNSTNPRALANAESEMRSLTDAVIENDTNGYKIKTLKGNTITSEEIHTAQEFSIERRGNGLNCSVAWAKLLEYYNQLYARGVLSQ